MDKTGLETLYKMLGNQNLSGMRTENSHLNEGSVFFMSNPNEPDKIPSKTNKRELTYHNGKAAKRTKVFIKNRFRLSLFKLLNIEEFTSTNDKFYAIAMKLITSITIITLFLIYSTLLVKG